MAAQVTTIEVVKYKREYVKWSNIHEYMLKVAKYIRIYMQYGSFSSSCMGLEQHLFTLLELPILVGWQNTNQYGGTIT